MTRAGLPVDFLMLFILTLNGVVSYFNATQIRIEGKKIPDASLYCKLTVNSEGCKSVLFAVSQDTIKLRSQIPQFLPVYSRKLRIYYPRLNRLCTNCYGGDARQRCRNQKVQWVSYH